MEYIDEVERAFGIGQEPFALATNELNQAEESGHDVSELRRRLRAVSPGDDEGYLAVYAATPTEAPSAGAGFHRSGLREILAELPQAGPAVQVVTRDSLASKLRGAWYGRVAGNMLGKPVEFGWSRARLKAYLEEQGAYPLRDYVPIVDLSDLATQGFTAEALLPYDRLFRGRIDGGVRDDDVDYTILAIHLLETYGEDFSTYDVAYEWLHRIPVYQTYTAERAAYQNLVREIPLENVGAFRNPYREWIGALIRADVFGFTHPGDPRRAAELAYKDAILSHRANGVYGAMWSAALIASAFTAESPDASVRESLRHVPAGSRLAGEIRRVLADYEAGRSWEQALDGVDARYPTMSWVHTLNNAGALTAAILWGDGDFSATIGYAVQAGLDTDSIGATAGAWAGIVAGFEALPAHWIEPLGGRTQSALFGFGLVSLDDMAARTLALVDRRSLEGGASR